MAERGSVPPGEGATVILGLGSNLGDRLGALRRAVRDLDTGLRVERVSSVYESRAEGGAHQPDYLNAVVVGTTSLDPAGVLALARAVETAAGRDRPYGGAPRTLDVDVLFLGRRTLDTSDLVVPHPRWCSRAFVLAPLLEVAPAWVDPASGRTVEEIARERLPGLEAARPVAPPEALTGAQPEDP